MEILSVLSAKQWKALSLPLPPHFFCIKLRCVEALTNDHHQSALETAQQRTCSTNGRAPQAGRHKQEGSWNLPVEDCWTFPLLPTAREPLQPLMQSWSLTRCLWSTALGCQKQQAVITSPQARIFCSEDWSIKTLPVQFNSHLVQLSWCTWLLPCTSVVGSLHVSTTPAFLWYTDTPCIRQQVFLDLWPPSPNHCE